jgi:hypothetical protein
MGSKFPPEPVIERIGATAAYQDENQDDQPDKGKLRALSACHPAGYRVRLHNNQKFKKEPRPNRGLSSLRKRES